jgi:stringent starvation protein B
MTADEPGHLDAPYLLRALHDWCTDNGFTPYIAVHVSTRVQVPMEYVKNNEIVLNVGFEATSGLKLGNEFVEFKARFGGVSREIVVPVDHVVAIYARENGQGMAFPVPTEGSGAAATARGWRPAAWPAPGLRLKSTAATSRRARTAETTRWRRAAPGRARPQPPGPQRWARSSASSSGGSDPAARIAPVRRLSSVGRAPAL